MADQNTKGLNRRWPFFRSIRFRIMMLLFVMGIVPALVAETVVVQSYESRALSQREIRVRNQCDILIDQLLKKDYLAHPDDEVINGEFDMLAGIYGGRILIINSESRVIKDTFNLDTGKYSLSREVIDCLRGKETSLYNEENQYLEMTMRIRRREAESSSLEGVLLISVSTSEIAASKVILEQRGSTILLVILLLVLVLGFWWSGMVVQPLQKISEEIEGISEGFQDEEISVPDYLETELITDSFNRMMTRVRAIDDSRDEFVSNVSHELKTPLASMKVLADALNMNPDAPVEQYREFMTDISEEIDRENSIITDLLSLVKMDRRAADLNIEEVRINDLLDRIIRRLRPIGDRQNVELILDSFRPVTAEIDSTKLTLAFSNIIENAIKYNKPEGGWVRVSLNADRKYFYVTIADSGIGIPEDSVDHVFERFYRVDKSHSREIGGTGLGLAITKSAILMHRGAIRVSSKLGEGTTFSIRIPLAYVA